MSHREYLEVARLPDEILNIEVPLVEDALSYISANANAETEYRDEFLKLAKAFYRCEWQIISEEPYETSGSDYSDCDVVSPTPRGDHRTYVDISNISAGIDLFKPGVINARGLHDFIGGKMIDGYVVGSFPDSSSSYWNDWTKLGYKVSIHRGGEEQGVDEKLHAVILRDAVKYRGSMVIVTGDGNSEGWTNFVECATMARGLGCDVKIVSWKHRLNKKFVEAGLKTVHLDREKATILN